MNRPKDLSDRYKRKRPRTRNIIEVTNLIFPTFFLINSPKFLFVKPK